MNEQFFGITDTGRQRQNNEDTFIAELTADNRFVIACVIDGVGGYSGGEIAAAIARDAILDRLDRPSGDIIPMIIDCFNQANEKILLEKQQTKDHDNMACVSTLAIVDIERNQFYFAHVGDTRLYLVRDGSLVKISHDQSFVGFLEDSGRLSESDAMKHPKRNEINKALGLDRHIGKDNDYIETGQSPFLPSDMLLLCSDGLTDMVSTAKITEIITTGESLKDKGTRLVAAANSNGGKDNITVVLVKNDKLRGLREAAKPATNVRPASKPIVAAASPRPPQPTQASQPEVVTKVNYIPVTILSILLLIVAGLAAWLFYQNQNRVADNNTRQTPVQTASTGAKPKNNQELKLQQAIDQAKGHTLILADTAFTAPIVISDAIQVNRDTLLIKAKGKIVLQCDTGYKGPAISFSARCKNIIMDSLQFINFPAAIAAVNDALVLKNVRFFNCQSPVQSVFSFADKKYVNGKISGVLFKADSIPVTTK